MRDSTLRNAVVVVLAGLLAACGPAPSETGAASAASTGAGGASAPGRDRERGRERDVVPVLTRNLYLGADLGPVIAAADLPSFLGATTAVWDMVQRNAFTLRVEGIADEIADERPALVGLQEAYVWTIQDPAAGPGQAAPAPRVVFDYTAQLLAALKARGLVYRVASSVDLFQFAAPILTGQTVGLADHGVILARSGVHLSNPVAQVYRTLLPLTVLGQPLSVQRGWVSVEVKDRGETFRFVSTHLESFHPLVRAAQAQELAAALAAEQRPVLLVGDLNSTVDEVVPQPPPAAPLPGARTILGAAGFEDAWARLHPAAAGFTCCFPEDLTRDGALDQRIDYVLFRGPFVPREAERLGATAAEKVSGLWPSDHAGLAAELRLRDPPGRGR